MPEPSRTAQSRRFNEALVEYFIQIDRGVPVDREAFAEQHPDVADELRAYFAESDQFRRSIETPSAKDTASWSPKNLVLPRTLGNYTLLEKIGQGGMGQVFKAEHRRMERLVAIKLLSGGLENPESLQRFHREVKAAAALSHPNIVAAYDADEADGVPFLVMEFIDGKDLSHTVRRGGPLPAEQAIAYVVQAAQGLAYAHGKGIVHRDIKPGALLVTADGTVKILDMGLARIESPLGAADSPAADLTPTGAVMGTVANMAPEQALDTHRADRRADVYSLGCTLHFLLTGRPPYQAETPVKVFLAHRESPIPELSQSRPDVPAALEAAFRRMMAKRPEDRPQSMDEVISSLEACLGWTAGPGRAARDSAGDIEAVFHAPCRILAVLRRKPILGAAAGLALLGIVGLALWSVTIRIRHRDGRETTVTVPEGSHVAVGADGQVDVTVKAEGGTGKPESGVPKPAGSAGPLAGARPGRQTKSPFPLGEEPGVRAPSPLIDLDGKWKLPPGAPPPAVAPFDEKKAREHQEAWAKYLGLPVEMTHSVGMKFVLIPPGQFDMGSTAEELHQTMTEAQKQSRYDKVYFDGLAREGPQHRVRLSKPFYLGSYEVTQEEYERVIGHNPSSFTKHRWRTGESAVEDTRRFPVEMVSWEEATEFCRAMSSMAPERAAQRTYRLPAEAEWEYACRAGSRSVYGFGDNEADLEHYAWFSKNSARRSHRVGEKGPNGWRLYDMHGNVWEWCAGYYDDTQLDPFPASDPKGPPSGSARVHRGGDWTSPPRLCRCDHRGKFNPTSLNGGTGFRVVCDVAGQRPRGKQGASP